MQAWERKPTTIRWAMAMITQQSWWWSSSRLRVVVPHEWERHNAGASGTYSHESATDTAWQLKLLTSLSLTLLSSYLTGSILLLLLLYRSPKNLIVKNRPAGSVKKENTFLTTKGHPGKPHCSRILETHKLVGFYSVGFKPRNLRCRISLCLCFCMLKPVS